MTDGSANLLDDFGSLGSDLDTKVFGSSPRPVCASEQYTESGFIALKDLAQELNVRILQITWQCPAEPNRRGRPGWEKSGTDQYK